METNIFLTRSRKLHLCRLCLLHKDSFVNIHEPNITYGFVIAAEIGELLQLRVVPDDGLPDGICFDCLFDLSRFKRFKKISHEAEVTLKYILNREEESMCPTIETTSNMMKEENEFDFEDNNIESQASSLMETNNSPTSSEETTHVDEMIVPENLTSSENTTIEEISEEISDINQMVTSEGKICKSKISKGKLIITINKSLLERNVTNLEMKSEHLRKTIKVEKCDSNPTDDKGFSESVPSTGIDMEKVNGFVSGGLGNQSNFESEEAFPFNPSNTIKCSGCVSELHDAYPCRNNLSSSACTSSSVCSICDSSFSNRVCQIEHQVSYRSPSRNIELKRIESEEVNYSQASNRNYSSEYPEGLNNCFEINNTKDQITSVLRRETRRRKCSQVPVDNPSFDILMKRGYFCDKCGSTFSKKTIFEHHLLKYHSQKLAFTCFVCNKSFQTKGGLKEHLVVHSTERPYMCDLCGSDFKLRKKLLRHMRNCHSKK